MSKEVLVIGGGIIGLCTAYYAARHGHRVTLIERGPADHDGCSLGNAGMVVPSHFVPLAAPGMVRQGFKYMWDAESPFCIKPRLSWDLIAWSWQFVRHATQVHVDRSAPLLRDLHLASRQCFEELADDSGNEFQLAKKGLLMLCKTTKAFEEEARVAEIGRKLGIPAETLTPEQAAALDANFPMDIAGAVHFPKDCHLTPALHMASLVRRTKAAGVKTSWETTAIDWRVSGNRITAAGTSRGDFRADEFVVCGGVWSPLLVKRLGLRLPVEAGKGYSLTLSNPRQLPKLCSILVEARVAVTPMGGALRFAGTMEIGGLDRTVNQARVRGIVKSIPQYFPAFTTGDFSQITPWSGLRPCSPDGLPYIGRVRRYANLTIAAGHAMMGVSLGPITGKLVAELLSGETPSFGIDALSPDRYN